jgi:hypothetical protein
MFLHDPSDSQRWFFSPKDREYVRVEVSHTGRVTYYFEIYGRMLQAMLEGYDEIQIQIANKMKFSFEYFKGPTPDDVENAAVGFVQNVSAELEILEKKETIVERTMSINWFVPDEIISQIGSGIITENNYTNFLEEIDVIRAAETSDSTILQLSGSELSALTSAPENVVPSSLAADLYENSGIFPGLISQVTFPRQCELDRESGSSNPRRKKFDDMLDQNPAFRDLYSHFFSVNSAKGITTSLSKGKPEFQKMNFNIAWRPTPNELLKLMYQENVLLRISLLKNGIEFVQENFSFQNDELFIRLSARINPVSVELLVNDPILALPDDLVVTNPNNFPVDIHINKFIPDGIHTLSNTLLADMSLNPRETKIIPSDTIHFAASETRGYTLTANRVLGNLPGVSNVRAIKTPPEITKPAIETIIPMLTVIETDSGLAISLSGLPEVGYSAILYRRELCSTKELIFPPKSTGNKTWSDVSMLPDTSYFYVARIFQNGAFGRLVAEAPALYSNLNDVSSRVTFQIVNGKSQRKGSNIFHSFKITQNVKTTSSEQMLEAVVASGEAGDFSGELEEQKADTTLVVDYLIYRFNKRAGLFTYLGHTQADKTLKYSVSAITSRNSVYYVVPRVSGTAALSFRTVTKEIDELSGREYSLRYKKWREPGVYRNEILPPTWEVFRDDVETALLNAPRGSVESIDLSTSSTIGRVRNIRAAFDPRTNTNTIMWEFSGTISNIAYFIVMANYNGVKAPVGLAIPDGKQRREIISYADTILGGAFGVIRYSIIPITTKGELRNESRTTKIKNMITFPQEALLRT